jgi:anti-sigma-K factor RskA
MTETSTRPRLFWVAWIAAASCLVLAGVAGVYAANLRNQLEDVELRLVDAVTKLQDAQERLVAAATDSDRVRANLALLSAPDATVFDMRGVGPAAPDAAARAFVSPARGLLFAASGLTPLPEGQTFQLWLLTAKGPLNAGIVQASQQGNVTAAFDPLPDASPATGFEVTVEPDGGSERPAGRVVLSSK